MEEFKPLHDNTIKRQSSTSGSAGATSKVFPAVVGACFLLTVGAVIGVSVGLVQMMKDEMSSNMSPGPSPAPPS